MNANSRRISVGVFGATGVVGQHFVSRLADHPWFELVVLGASERSAGRTYADACRWSLSPDPPPVAAQMTVRSCDEVPDCEVVFSALPTDRARYVERRLAEAGVKVFTNASAHRMRPDVPLLIPEVNPDHLGTVEGQSTYGSGGFIVANPNCSATVVATALAPLHKAFGVRSVVVHTMQALSGAGHPGVPALDALDTVVPFVPGEEEKLPAETRKMLGSLDGGRVVEAAFAMSAHCNRVPVRDGHLETVSVAFERTASPDDVARAWTDWTPEPQRLGLPSAPAPPISVRAEADRPQSRLDRDAGGGMTTTVGRLRPCEVLDVRFVSLSHNAVRGAAGGSVLNAELALAKGLLR